MAEALRKTGLNRLGHESGRVMRFADIRRTDATITHSAAADHFGLVGDWGLYGNDRFGDCGPTSVANLRKLVSKYLAAMEQSPTQADVFDLYKRSGNPDFDPDTGAGDNGVEMQVMLKALHDGGIGNVKPLAYAKVDHTNPDEMWAATEIFGGLLLGVDLKQAQDEQTNEGLWDYVRRSGEWGGHAVLTGRYNDVTGTKQDRTGVVTWATVVDYTDAFGENQVQEAWVVIWPENTGTKQFREGIDQEALAAAYQSLTQQPFPEVDPTPTPDPTPAPPAPSGGYSAQDLANDVRTLLTDKGF